MKKLILIIAMILCTSSANAAYWYVDNAATGSNNGTTWTNAWKTLAGVVWGTGGVQAGDTLWISGGSGSKTYNITWDGTTGDKLTPGASGTSESPIYIKPGAAHPTLSTGHDGVVIFDCGGAYDWAFKIYGRDYITVDGSSGTYQIVPIGQNAHRKFRFQNTILDRDDRTLLFSYSGIGLRILNSEFVTSGYGLYAQSWCTAAGSQCEIAGNYFHDIRGQGAICLTNSSGTSPRYDAILIHDNEIQINSLQNNGNGPDGILGSNGLTIYNNLFYGLQLGSDHVFQSQHQDFIQGLGIYYKIYNNIFRNPGSTGVRSNWSNNPGGYWQVYNNVFEINDSAFDVGTIVAAEIVSSTPSGGTLNDILVANNTIVDFKGSYGINLGLGTSQLVTSNVKIQNNIVYQSGMPNQHEAIRVSFKTCNDGKGITVDNNLIYKGSSYGSQSVTCNNIEITQPTGYLGQPSFVSYSRLSSGNNYSLSGTDTQAKNRGVSFLSYFTTDFRGTLRPQGPTWDIGAFQSSSVKRLVAPNAQIIPSK